MISINNHKDINKIEIVGEIQKVVLEEVDDKIRGHIEVDSTLKGKTNKFNLGFYYSNGCNLAKKLSKLEEKCSTPGNKPNVKVWAEVDENAIEKEEGSNDYTTFNRLRLKNIDEVVNVQHSATITLAGLLGEVIESEGKYIAKIYYKGYKKSKDSVYEESFTNWRELHHVFINNEYGSAFSNSQGQYMVFTLDLFREEKITAVEYDKTIGASIKPAEYINYIEKLVVEGASFRHGIDGEVAPEEVKNIINISDSKFKKTPKKTFGKKNTKAQTEEEKLEYYETVKDEIPF